MAGRAQFGVGGVGGGRGCAKDGKEIRELLHLLSITVQIHTFSSPRAEPCNSMVNKSVHSLALAACEMTLPILHGNLVEQHFTDNHHHLWTSGSAVSGDSFALEPYFRVCASYPQAPCGV